MVYAITNNEGHTRCLRTRIIKIQNYGNLTFAYKETAFTFKLSVFKTNISNRGPDYFNVIEYANGSDKLIFASSVLWLQGYNLTEQPLQNENSVFIYNGDIFDGLGNSQNDGDTRLIYQILQTSNCLNDSLSQLHGPYAFVYLDKVCKRLYFGRDIYGRRSLLLGRNFENDQLMLTSVAKKNTKFNFIELPSVGIFCLNLETNELEVLPWKYRNKNFSAKLKEVEQFLNKHILIKDSHIPVENGIRRSPKESELSLLRSVKGMPIEEAFGVILSDERWSENIQCLKALIENAIQKRISIQPGYCKDCIKEKLDCAHATVGILFSGGVDCAVLALLSDKFVDKNKPIDLINVSFDDANNYRSPDRTTGIATLNELRSCCPERQWNFIEVNVTKEELNEKREEQIADLIYPLNTILDESLGCALWFASRGMMEDYVSPCRVLLVGMGADELFGGYTKHRAAFKRESWQGLQEMLNEDWQNLPHRNLARDDRVVSDHGRQLRTPYLDENVVQFVRGLQCWEKTWPTSDVPQGFGEKILLRTLAYSLGLKNAATFKKRALQFGSRIANSKENAHEVSKRL